MNPPSLNPPPLNPAPYYHTELRIGQRKIGLEQPTYFIADVASNHDGSLERAKRLIELCHSAGADAVKFQHFRASEMVSDYGFQRLGGAVSHQAGWSGSVYDVYRQHELDRDWTEQLAAVAQSLGIDFLTTPYDVAAVDRVAALVPAFKIGSGDITYPTIVRRIAAEGKPVLLATGAADLSDVQRAVEIVLEQNPALALMQCNTNYTGSAENFRYLNLRVLQTFAERWPGLVLGLSDHTPGHASALGAVSLGARVIEKHFTDDNAREGPDHAFAMTPSTWSEMVQRTRELEQALGDGVKRVEDNELDTVIVQRRCIRLARDLRAGVPLTIADLECLRPAEPGSLEPYRVDDVVGRTLARDLVRGHALRPADLRSA
jgi:sialic acid synthase SpsE